MFAVACVRESEVEFYKRDTAQRTWLAPIKFYKCTLMREHARVKGLGEQVSAPHQLMHLMLEYRVA